MICVSLSSKTQQELASEIQLNLPYSTFFEFRITEDTLSLLPWILRKERSYQALITLRNSEQGHLSSQERIQILQQCLEKGAEFIDWDEDEKFPITSGSEKVISSYHNYNETPSCSEMMEIFEKRKFQQSVVKLVFQANHFKDNQIIKEFLQKVPSERVISFCMGEVGKTSRILASSWGSLWTYAAPAEDRKTASGQLTAKELVKVYRYSEIPKLTQHLYGILGKPVSHSLSPLLHNKAFQEKGLSALYLPVEVESPKEVLPNFFFEGLSVTMPFKETIFKDKEYLKLSSSVSKWGAINTLALKKGHYFAENTDIPAGITLIEKELKTIAQKKVVIWGSGGVAKSFALALAEKKAKIWIQARNEEKGKEIAQRCGGRYWNWQQEIPAKIDLLIQGTPLGMWPKQEEVPGTLDLFPQGVEVLFETIYRPAETLLMQQARQRDMKIISGVDFFLLQANLQQKIWTGTGFNLEIWKKLLLDTFEEEARIFFRKRVSL